MSINMRRAECAEPLLSSWAKNRRETLKYYVCILIRIPMQTFLKRETNPKLFGYSGYTL